jgi:hypothetical protein
MKPAFAKKLSNSVKKPRFTEVCYGIIAVLVENPQAVFALTEQRIAERMVNYGWLTQETMEIPQTAGNYQYNVKVTGFRPTPEGLTKYEELKKLIVPDVSLDQLEKAYRGEYRKEVLKRKLVK